MSPIRVIALVLLIGGVLALAYGGFGYTQDKTALKVGSLAVSVKEHETVNIPVWAGIAAVVVGGLLLVTAGKRG